ncbi:stalk domain-containing protein [Halalkalibacter nanhaiisediminis]|uniref:Copper amine oxidase-like protein n=1 Tax=Halalkalibacter nanhaiisediminis TaxID=688079 RepID=A0A562QPK0_9BACI|nr:stalk domain-containing protein [Halalkalibacter nanhaiisediminis]TWI57986.1 copper amine oxidase-like protein [Halalkalibacter nanhaiisediminis]
MKKAIYSMSALLIGVSLVLSPAVSAQSNNDSQERRTTVAPEEAPVSNEESNNGTESAISEDESEDDDEQQETVNKEEMIQKLHSMLEGAQGATANEVITNLLKQNFDLEELLSSFKELAEVEIEEGSGEKKEEYKAYAETLREQFEKEKASLKEKLEKAKEVSEELYEKELEIYQNMLENLAELYEKSGDIQSAFNLQSEAVKANLSNLESYKKLATLYEETHNYQGIKAFVNGEHPTFDVPPMVKEGRTLIPFRTISEALQANVSWVAEDRAVVVEKDGVEVKLVIGVKQAFVNGQQVSLDVPAEIIDGRTVVPLRFLSEAFGANVQWEAETRSVVIVEE